MTWDLYYISIGQLHLMPQLSALIYEAALD